MASSATTRSRSSAPDDGTMNERRVKRLEAQIKARAAEIIAQELADPRRGMITVTRVELDRELELCKVFWSILGDDKDRKRNARMLEQATGFVRRGVAKILHTRTAPRIRFVFDESIAGAMRVQGLLDDLRREREARGEVAGEGDGEA